MKLTNEQFIERSKIIHNNKYDYSLVEYNGYREKVKLICPIHGVFEQKAKNHIHGGYGCYKCGKVTKLLSLKQNLQNRKKNPKKNERMTREIFVKIANAKYNNKYDYNSANYIDSSNRIKIICPIHGPFFQKPVNHLYCGCKQCSIDVKKRTTEDFIKISKKLFPNKLTYEKTIYTSNMGKIILTCNKHGDYDTYAYDHMRGKLGCKYCRSSIGESIIYNLLLNNNIEFIKEYKIPGYKFRYDFYLPSLKVLIEFDGIQHFKPVSLYGGERGLLTVKKRDRAKNKIAKIHGYKLYRIPFYKAKDMEEYLTKKLNIKK